jgi:hypothetical protein
VSTDLAFRTYVLPAAPPVTVASLCRDTVDAIRSSPRYPRNKPTLDALATRLCEGLAALAPRLSIARKRLLISAYKAGVRALVTAGWITTAQAAELSAKADRLLSSLG